MTTSDLTTVDVGRRLDRMPLTSFHRRLLALIGAGLFLDGFELYLTAGVLGSLTKSGWSTMSSNAAFVSATFIGMVIGAWAAGICGDRFGRRFTYQFNLLVFGGASLVAAFAPNMTTLIGLRFVMGIGLGAEVIAGYATLTEFVPARVRGRMIGWLAVITNSSLFVATILGSWIIPTFGWRYMFGIVGIGALIIWAMRRSFPESPRWLESQGRDAEADGIVKTIEASATTPLPPLPPLGRAAPVILGASTISVWTVFKPPVLGRTLIGILVNIVIGFSLYGFISWLPTFFVKQGVSIVSSLTWTAIMALGAPAGAFVGLLLADRVGRRPLIVAASLWAAAFGAAFAYAGQGAFLIPFGFCLFVGVYAILAVAFALYVPELFRTEYRFRGVAVCGTAGRIATACVQFVVVWLFTEWGLAGVVTLLVSLLLLQAAVFALFGIETSGRTLEEIDRSFVDADPRRSEPSSHAAI